MKTSHNVIKFPRRKMLKSFSDKWNLGEVNVRYNCTPPNPLPHYTEDATSEKLTKPIKPIKHKQIKISNSLEPIEDEYKEEELRDIHVYDGANDTVVIFSRKKLNALRDGDDDISWLGDNQIRYIVREWFSIMSQFED